MLCVIVSFECRLSADEPHGRLPTNVISIPANDDGKSSRVGIDERLID